MREVQVRRDYFIVILLCFIVLTTNLNKAALVADYNLFIDGDPRNDREVINNQDLVFEIKDSYGFHEDEGKYTLQIKLHDTSKALQVIIYEDPSGFVGERVILSQEIQASEVSIVFDITDGFSTYYVVIIYNTTAPGAYSAFFDL